MPEPDFKTPTRYSTPKLTFGSSLFKNKKEVDSYWGTHTNTGSKTSYASPKERETYGIAKVQPKFPTYANAKERETYGGSSAVRTSLRPKVDFGSVFTSVFGGSAVKSPVSSAQDRIIPSASVGYKTADQFATQAIKDVVNIPTLPTITEDGGAGVLSGLKDMAGGILGMIGSGGDETVVTPVSYGATDQADGILGDPVVLGALVLGAGVVFYMVAKK